MSGLLADEWPQNWQQSAGSHPVDATSPSVRSEGRRDLWTAGTGFSPPRRTMHGTTAHAGRSRRTSGPQTPGRDSRDAAAGLAWSPGQKIDGTRSE